MMTEDDLEGMETDEGAGKRKPTAHRKASHLEEREDFFSG